MADINNIQFKVKTLQWDKLKVNVDMAHIQHTPGDSTILTFNTDKHIPCTTAGELKITQPDGEEMVFNNTIILGRRLNGLGFVGYDYVIGIQTHY